MRKAILLSILILGGLFAMGGKEELIQPEKKAYTFEAPIGVFLKELGLTNFKGAQPDSLELIQMLENYPIDIVVRLNADGDKMSIEEEAGICARYNVRFYYFNIEGNTKAEYRKIRNFLQDGNTLVHCLHGFDRAGVIAGLWMKENGSTDQEIVAYNKWENYIEKKGEKYRKYWDVVFE